MSDVVLGPGSARSEGASVLALYLLVGGFIGPLVEEIFFRGLIQQLIRQSFGAFTTILASTALFVAVHALNASGVHPVTHVVGGLLFAVLYEKSRSVIAPFIVHASGNAAMILLDRFMR
ncbi:MAG: CPBP family intramembrane glutamic endopeptidase [Planctomycetota bacterium]|nr:CPBP family intramembrane glutamic endopeptidase [Planctomycetota bacterium]